MAVVHNNATALVSHGYKPDEEKPEILPLQNCQGDCDHDAHCLEGYRCHQNDRHMAIPGCKGKAEEAMDYCVKAYGSCAANKMCAVGEFETQAPTPFRDRDCRRVRECSSDLLDDSFGNL